jgi:hypothetical protein
LGYFGLAYYLENKESLQAVAVDGGKGGVLPSMETVKNGAYAPLSRPIFIYVSKKAARRPEVKRYVEFYIKHASTLVSEVKYVPLPGSGIHRRGGTLPKRPNRHRFRRQGRSGRFHFGIAEPSSKTLNHEGPAALPHAGAAGTFGEPPPANGGSQRW